MRSNLSTICDKANQPNALAAVYYDRADTSKPPTSTAWPFTDPGTCANDDLSLTVPYYSLSASTPSVTQNMDIAFHFNSTGHLVWTLGGQTFRANYNQPVLLLANEKNLTYPDIWNVQNFGTNSTIRIIINNPGPAPHPMHLHGHNMQILHEGPGNYDGSSITNANNPARRDVQLVRNGGHMVMQYTTDNPGVWPFHCHIVWHVSGGLYANMMERPGDIASKVDIPSIMPQTCTDWVGYTNRDVVDQIDSGV
jgi:FtsP/CotA-like multicopper oxidase with cupredoxin domain